MEPSPITEREIGKICSAWASLEFVSEALLWGILQIDQTLGKTFTWKLGMRDKWATIMKEAKDKLSEDDLNELKTINKLVAKATRQRNIVVHGVIRAIIAEHPNIKTITRKQMQKLSIIQQPCWTIFMGEDAGKNFIVDHKSARMIRDNIQKVGKVVFTFNEKRGFNKHSGITNVIEGDWPEPL